MIGWNWKRQAGSEELEVMVAGCHFLLWSAGNGNFPGRLHAAISVAAIDFIIYKFIEITTSIPPLTIILDRLIKGGISPYSDVI